MSKSFNKEDINDVFYLMESYNVLQKVSDKVYTVTPNFKYISNNKTVQRGILLNIAEFLQIEEDELFKRIKEEDELIFAMFATELLDIYTMGRIKREVKPERLLKITFVMYINSTTKIDNNIRLKDWK